MVSFIVATTLHYRLPGYVRSGSYTPSFFVFLPNPGGQFEARDFIFVPNVWDWSPEHNWSGGQREFDITPFTEFSLRLIRDGFTEKVAVLLDFVQITSPPSPQFGQLVPLF